MVSAHFRCSENPVRLRACTKEHYRTQNHGAIKQFRLKGQQEATQTIPPALLMSTEGSLCSPQFGVIDTDISPKCHTGHDSTPFVLKHVELDVIVSG